ncbi:MAG: Stp1/IreP family PP2C-type Ser/Thr phosphatase, partial [Myxococcota bacterium]
MSSFEITARGKTHPGRVRKGNEDALHIDEDSRVFVVLDGMGGAMAGEVASGTARDVIAEYVRERRGDKEARELIEAAIQAANNKVHREAKRRSDRHGMGTTVVACAIDDDHRAIIAHVGDSRAYLWRDGRLQLITRDHTVVADLLSKKIITQSEAEHHPYNNVLSRNLGSKPRAKVDVTDLPLRPGDRLLLCSDGLTGYASSEAIEQTLGGSEGADSIVEDLVELALRGGGGDNVTALVIDTGRTELPQDTQVIRTSGAVAWWRRRDMFLAEARKGGLCDSPVCSVLSPDEALEIVAGNLCEAIFHDLEQTTGINVWTYAENLGKGWFDQEGDYQILRDLIDILHRAARAVLHDIESTGEPYARGLDIAVTRGLTVAEMAIGGLLADRLRQVESELVDLRARKQQAESGEVTAQTLLEQPTVPFMSSTRVEPASPDVLRYLDRARTAAEQTLVRSGNRSGAREFIERAHNAACDPLRPAEIELSGREFLGDTSDETGVSPLFDAIDQARYHHLEAAARLDGDREICAAAA